MNNVFFNYLHGNCKDCKYYKYKNKIGNCLYFDVTCTEARTSSIMCGIKGLFLHYDKNYKSSNYENR